MYKHSWIIQGNILIQDLGKKLPIKMSAISLCSHQVYVWWLLPWLQHKEELALLIYQLQVNVEDVTCHWQYWLFNLPSLYLLLSSTPFPIQEKNYLSTLQRGDTKSQTLQGRKLEQLKLFFASSVNAISCNSVYSSSHLFHRPQENTAFIPPPLKPTRGVWYLCHHLEKQQTLKHCF